MSIFILSTTSTLFHDNHKCRQYTQTLRYSWQNIGAKIVSKQIPALVNDSEFVIAT